MSKTIRETHLKNVKVIKRKAVGYLSNAYIRRNKVSFICYGRDCLIGLSNNSLGNLFPDYKNRLLKWTVAENGGKIMARIGVDLPRISELRLALLYLW